MLANKSIPHWWVIFLLALGIGGGIPGFLPGDMPGGIPGVLPGGVKVYAGRLAQFKTRHYVVYTNAGRQRAKFFARHMDRIFNEYQKRFEQSDFKRDGSNKPMALYLLKTQQDYIQQLAQFQVNATNSGGMFVVSDQTKGLFTFLEGRPVGQTISVLQHEGFHQFAYRFMGPHLPIWVNEGLAQYFEDGILVGKHFYLDIANARRVRTIRQALKDRQTLPFDLMLSMSDQTWSTQVRQSPALAALQYDQAWSMTFFLINADQKKYRQAFTHYLLAVGKKTPSKEAFVNAFARSDVSFENLVLSFQRAWQRYSSQIEPDPLSEAIDRMKFLAQGLGSISRSGVKMPKTTRALRTILQQVGYQVMRKTHSLEQVYIAADESMYRYQPNGSSGPQFFEMLTPSQRGLPPRLKAPGLQPVPTLVWYKDTDGKLYHDVIYH